MRNHCRDWSHSVNLLCSLKNANCRTMFCWSSPVKASATHLVAMQSLRLELRDLILYGDCARLWSRTIRRVSMVLTLGVGSLELHLVVDLGSIVADTFVSVLLAVVHIEVLGCVVKQCSTLSWVHWACFISWWTRHRLWVVISVAPWNVCTYSHINRLKIELWISIRTYRLCSLVLQVKILMNRLRRCKSLEVINHFEMLVYIWTCFRIMCAKFLCRLNTSIPTVTALKWFDTTLLGAFIKAVSTWSVDMHRWFLLLLRILSGLNIRRLWWHMLRSSFHCYRLVPAFQIIWDTRNNFAIDKLHCVFVLLFYPVCFLKDFVLDFLWLVWSLHLCIFVGKLKSYFVSVLILCTWMVWIRLWILNLPCRNWLHGVLPLNIFVIWAYYLRILIGCLIIYAVVLVQLNRNVYTAIFTFSIFYFDVDCLSIVSVLGFIFNFFCFVIWVTTLCFLRNRAQVVSHFWKCWGLTNWIVEGRLSSRRKVAECRRVCKVSEDFTCV